MGGTYDPVHIGHLRSAEEITSLLGVSTIKLIPSFIPPHRSLPGTSAAQRLDMLELAVSNNDRLEVDPREVRRQGKSYSIDTLGEIRNEIGISDPLYFVLGFDAFLLIEEWHRWRELTDLAHLVVIDRPLSGDSNIVGMSDVLRAWSDSKLRTIDELAKAPAGFLCFVELTQLAVSSTRIRQMVVSEESTRYLLPDAVREYIGEQGLYG